MTLSHASESCTKSFSAKFPGILYKSFGKTGLTVSGCGFGSYRVDYRVKEHADSLEYAISNGINLIDTSANYSDGGSEILIGNVIKKMATAGTLKREEIVVVSKGGYIQGKNFEAAQQMKEDGKGYKEVVEYADKLWHCIHPDFLKDQITLSLERMQLESIDAYLLHNPEYFLDSPAAKELMIDELRHEYYSRIKKAFAYLETEAEKGRICCYGISSNSFVYDEGVPTFTSLEQCLAAAKEIKKDNNFKVIQFPLNLYERGAVVIKNQRANTITLLELASEYEMGTIVNRPLNAISGKSLLRLADFEINKDYTTIDETQIVAEIGLLESLEDDFVKESLPLIDITNGNREAITYFLKAGQLLRENWKSLGSIESFNDLKKQFLIPRVNYAFSMMLEAPNITDEIKEQLDRIAKQVNKLMAILETLYGTIANERSVTLHNKLNEIISSNNEFAGLKLSQKSLLMVNSLPGVSCTLVGMRQNKYVDDVVSCLKQKQIVNAAEKWKEIKL